MGQLERGRTAARAAVAIPAAARDEGQRREPRRSLRRLGSSQRAVALLAAVALISAFGLAGITYVAARANAISAAQTRALQDAQVARQLILDQGANVTVHDGQLVVGVDDQGYTLNGDTTLVDRSRSLDGGYTTIYALDGSGLTSVASNLPGAGGKRAVGDALTGAPFDALVGNCGPVDAAACHQTYAGVMTVHGRDYVAGFQPLFDGGGSFVGALGVALPLGDVLMPVNQLAVVLLLVGLLLSFLSIVTGSWLLGSRSEQLLTTLDARLDAVAAGAAELERLARAEVDRAQQRGRAARQVSEQARTLDALAGAMEQGEATLRDSAGAIWNEMSQPGAVPDPQAALHLARQAAVVSARLGTSAERAREACRQLVTMMNHIVAEADAARDGGGKLRRCAEELRAAVEGVEVTIGDRLIKRPHGMDALPIPRHVRRFLTAAPQKQSSEQGSATRRQAPAPAAERGRDGGPAVSERLWLGRGRSQPGQTGRHPAAGISHAGTSLPGTSSPGGSRPGALLPGGSQPRPGALLPGGSQPRPGALLPGGSQPRPGDAAGRQPRVHPEQPPATGQHPRAPRTLSGWTGQHPALPPTMPINRADRPGLPDDPSASGGGQTGRHSAADWSGEFSARNPAQRPPSGTGKMPGVPQRGPVSSLPPTPPGFGLPGFDGPEQPRPGTPGASGSFGWPYPEE